MVLSFLSFSKIANYVEILFFPDKKGRPNKMAQSKDFTNTFPRRNQTIVLDLRSVNSSHSLKSQYRVFPWDVFTTTGPLYNMQFVTNHFLLAFRMTYESISTGICL